VTGRGTLLLGSVAALVASASPAAAQRGVDAGRFGPWHSWCAVDGALAGFDQPECRTTASFGSTTVDLVRTASGMEVSLGHQRCRALRGVTLPEARITDPSAGSRRLQGVIATLFQRCKLPAPTLRRRDLQRVLRATARAF